MLRHSSGCPSSGLTYIMNVLYIYIYMYIPQLIFAHLEWQRIRGFLHTETSGGFRVSLKL